jgi:hypothetical protein
MVNYQKTSVYCILFIQYVFIGEMANIQYLIRGPSYEVSKPKTVHFFIKFKFT